MRQLHTRFPHWLQFFFFFLGHTARQAFHGTPKQAAELNTEREETENSLCFNTTADTLPLAVILEVDSKLIHVNV